MPSPPRQLRFASISDAVAEVDRLRAAASDSDATIVTRGAWSEGRIVQHVADTITASLDGFGDAIMQVPDRPQVPRRLVERMLEKGLRPGFQLPGAVEDALPGQDTPFDLAVANFKTAVARIEAGERMEGIEQPFMGSFSHEEWLKFHCRHAELHFGFMGLEGEL